MTKLRLKMKLIFWKNIRIRCSTILSTVFEIIIPVTCLLIFVSIKYLVRNKESVYINEIEYFPIESETNKLKVLYYTPNNKNTNKLMEILKSQSLSATGEIRVFQTETMMMNSIINLKKIKTRQNTVDVPVGIVFDNINEYYFPRSLRYRIRTEIPDSLDINMLYSIFSPFEASEFYLLYFSSDFISVQKAVDVAFIYMHNKLNITISCQQKPHPPHWRTDNVMDNMFFSLLPMLIIFAFMLTLFAITRRVLDEKCAGMTELMKMMGLRPWMLWLGWFIHSMITMLPSVLIIILLLKVQFSKNVPPIFEYSNAFILIIFLFMYCTSMICFGFFISSLFNKPIIGSAVALIIWTISSWPASHIMHVTDPKSFTFLRSLILMFPNTCLMYGIDTAKEFERQETGVIFNNLYQVPVEFASFHSMGKIMLILLIESVILLLLTWYIGQVRPGEFGIRKPWNFICKRNEKYTSDFSDEDTISRDEVESASFGLETGIQIRRLCKKFNKTIAVRNLTFDIYANEITVLLGHNGAGKTTTMNIMSGMCEATSGQVLVGGYDIHTNMDKVRESLGLCPQHSVHFPDLTVLEHLIFFAMLKGMTGKAAKAEALDYLNKLGMLLKKNDKAQTLSEGMKRRLSLGLALVGPTKVLMLDEPTSGMDPEARREIWDLLLNMRGSRTILITTHYMEEADILGDRIAIMHNGHLTCYGTSLFLKKQYGAGYTLSVQVGPKYDLNRIINAIRNHISNAQVKSVILGTIKIELPTNNTSALTKLFLDLDKTKENLGISAFGVSLTTMDDVFLKVGKITGKTDKQTNTTSIDSPETNMRNAAHAEEEGRAYNRGTTLFKQQFKALFVKRIQYHRHKWVFFLLAILAPIVCQLLVELSYIGITSKLDVNRILTLASYPSATSYFSYAEDNFDLSLYYPVAVRHQGGYSKESKQVSLDLIKEGIQNIDRYQHKLVTAAELNYSARTIRANALYEPYAVHSPAISVNLITNAILKYALNDYEASITVGNNPIESSSELNIKMFGIMLCYMVPFGITLCFGLLLMFHVDERVSGVKHLQIMYGVPRYIYWLTNYLFDMCVYLGVVVVLVIIVISFCNLLSYPCALGAFAVLLILFGMAMLPFSYFFHYRPDVGNLMNYMQLPFIIFSVILPIIFVFVFELASENQKNSTVIVAMIFMLSPHFAVSDGIYELVYLVSMIHSWESNNQNTQCEQKPPPPCCDPSSEACRNFYNFYTADKLLANFIILFFSAIIYSALFLFIDYGYVTKYANKVRDSKIFEQDGALDSDVRAEQKRVSSQMKQSAGLARKSEDSDVLLVSNLQKSFHKFPAVKGLSFKVQKSECFGLLGINGAGKTTTFKMLVGEIFPTTGTANIFDYSLQRNRAIYLKQIGYCPQSDALNFQLTCRELLTFFGHLRGIQENKIMDDVDKWLMKLDLNKYENIQAEKLSGGNKRKLSTSIALIGDPPIVMLDEPTSGVDPVARRNLWGILAQSRKAGQAIILTSHSMDECEALCDRLAIMVDGQLQCIGNIQHLKGKYGQGFTVMIKLKYVKREDDASSFEKKVEGLKQAIEMKYACTLKDEHKGMVLYHITHIRVTLGAIFEFMETLKETRDIVEDFTVSDTSLEQVFISFAKERIANIDNKSQESTIAKVV